MGCAQGCKVKKKRKVLNIVEIGDGGLVYIRLDDGKKYLLTVMVVRGVEVLPTVLGIK